MDIKIKAKQAIYRKGRTYPLLFSWLALKEGIQLIPGF